MQIMLENVINQIFIIYSKLCWQVW